MRTKIAKVRENLILRTSGTIAPKAISSTVKNAQLHNGFLKQPIAMTKKDQFVDLSWLAKKSMVMSKH